MAGHSHAKNVMHRKQVQGAKRARAYGKLIREITVSAKQGLPDPAHNPRLRAAVKAALTANMTRDTIDRAIKRGAGSARTSVHLRPVGNPAPPRPRRPASLPSRTSSPSRSPGTA